MKEIPIKKESEIDVSDFIYADFDGHDEDSSILSSHEKFTEVSGEYKCDLCDHITSELRYLKQHKKTHMAGKFRCEDCEYSAHKPYVMKSHMNKVHNIDNVVYLCDRENTDVRHYLCNLCSYSNIDAKKLESHMQNKHFKNNEQDKGMV